MECQEVIISKINIYNTDTLFTVLTRLLYYYRILLLISTHDMDIVYSATCLHVTLYIYTYTIKYVTYNIS